MDFKRIFGFGYGNGNERPISHDLREKELIQRKEISGHLVITMERSGKDSVKPVTRTGTGEVKLSPEYNVLYPGAPITIHFAQSIAEGKPAVIVNNYNSLTVKSAFREGDNMVIIVDDSEAGIERKFTIKKSS